MHRKMYQKEWLGIGFVDIAEVTPYCLGVIKAIRMAL